MKKLILFVGFVVLGISNSYGQDNKGAFFVAVQNVSKSEAMYVFLVDQILESRCKKPQSINYLKEVAQSNLSIHLALKAGDYEKAKQLLASIPCEDKKSTP